MPHLTLVAFSGVRVREARLAELGATLPGLEARAAAIAALPPLGLLTLAGLTAQAWSITLHEPGARSASLLKRVVSESPALVAISALTASIGEAYALADGLRREGIRVVLGGLHVTACPGEALSHADAVVIGEGEPVWPAVLADAERGALRQRYCAARPFDLAESPLPRYGLLGRGTRRRYTVQTSRGCPLACDFCGASRLLGAFRRKPAGRVAAELAAIAAIDRRPAVELADDNTFAAGGPHDDLLDALAAYGTRWFTETDWRLGENPAVLQRLAASGCVQVLVGLESLVHAHRGMGAKRTPLSRMMEAVEAIQSAGVAVIGCFIAGSDGETRGSLERLGRFLEADPCADVQVTLQTPFPGTALRRRLERAGRLLPDRDWSHFTLFDVTFRPDHMEPAELQSAFDELLAAVFGPEQARRRREIRRSIWQRNPMVAGA